MIHHMFFPFSEYWWFYLAFTAFVMIVLVLDLGVFHKKAHTISLKEAGTWTVIWVILSLLFNYGFYYFALYKFNAHQTLSLRALLPSLFHLGWA